MKKSLIIVLSFGLFFVACTKENSKPTPPPTSNGKYPVHLNVVGFSASLGDFNDRKIFGNLRGANDTIADYVRYLAYNVYNATTSAFIKTIYQVKAVADTNFGKIVDTLPNGGYIISITAARDSVLPDPLYFNGGMANPGGIPEGFAGKYPGTDVFYKKMNISVDSGAVTQEVVLDRIVSMLKVVIEDSIPANAKYINITPTKYPINVPDTYLPSFFQYKYGNISTGWQGTDNYYTYQVEIPDSAKKPNFQLETYILNTTSQQISVNISCTDAGNVILAQKKVDNITIENNKKTVLKGILFNHSGGNNGVTVGVNGSWKTDITVQF